VKPTTRKPIDSGVVEVAQWSEVVAYARPTDGELVEQVVTVRKFAHPHIEREPLWINRGRNRYDDERLVQRRLETKNYRSY
jgi:hypothetical protein